MAIRIRKDGTMWCAAHTDPLPGDTYIDDSLHYQMSVENGVIVALPMPEHINNPQWWWTGNAPSNADMKMANINYCDYKQGKGEMYDWETELKVRAEDVSYGVQTNKVCSSAIEEINRLRSQVDRFADGQLYQDRKIRELNSELNKFKKN